MDLSTLRRKFYHCVQLSLMDGREIVPHPHESKLYSPSLHRRARQPLHEKYNGHHLP